MKFLMFEKFFNVTNQYTKYLYNFFNKIINSSNKTLPVVLCHENLLLDFVTCCEGTFVLPAAFLEPFSDQTP